MKHKALLVLDDGTIFSGLTIDAENAAANKEVIIGEVVFNTSMTGHQEILSDPSYAGQILVMTCPEVGNAGCNAEDAESHGIHVAALITRRICFTPSNWRAQGALTEWLEQHSIAVVTDLDTRALVVHLRSHGSQLGIIGAAQRGAQSLLAQLHAHKAKPAVDWVNQVSTKTPYSWTKPTTKLNEPRLHNAAPSQRGGQPPLQVAVLDLGVKHSILRQLVDAGCEATVWPARTSAKTLLATRPDGILISNGPGDPAVLPHIVQTVADLVGRVPLFGICLGHQLLACALGGQTYKMTFGHRGSNHPVRDLASGRVLITAQNHGYAVRASSLGDAAQMTHVAVNDGSVAGISASPQRAFGVQFHPEASPGPHDAQASFGRFLAAMKEAA